MAERQNPFHRLLRIPALYSFVQRWFQSNAVYSTLLGTIGATSGDRVLDIGSGVSTILGHLPEGVSYIGYEPNPAYVAKAKAVYGDRGIFRVGYLNADAVAELAPVDIAIVLAVLHHMSDAEARDLFALLARVLKPNGRVVTFDNVFVPKQNPIAWLLISLDRGRNVRTPERYRLLARDAFREVQGDVHHLSFPPYTYWIMQAAGPRAPRQKP